MFFVLVFLCTTKLVPLGRKTSRYLVQTCGEGAIVTKEGGAQSETERGAVRIEATRRAQREIPEAKCEMTTRGRVEA